MGLLPKATRQDAAAAQPQNAFHMPAVIRKNGKKLSKGEFALAERQALLDRRGIRKHKKRHGENRERSHRARAKAQKVKAEELVRAAKRKKYLAAARAYYSGEADDMSHALQALAA